MKNGFTIIEIIIAMAMTTIFMTVFVQISLPVKDTLSKKYLEIESYQQLLFVDLFLDDLVHLGNTEISSSTIDIKFGSSTRNDFYGYDKQIRCGLNESVLECKFIYFSTNREVTIPILPILRFGTSTVFISKDLDNDQYYMNIGKCILQFGIFPHIYMKS